MNFQNIPPVETFQTYLDYAFQGAQRKLEKLRIKFKDQKKIEKSKSLEIERIRFMEKSLTTSLKRIITNFPRTDVLPQFYQELIHNTLDIDQLKQSLGAVNWAAHHISILAKENINHIKTTKQTNLVNKHRIAFSGRTSATLKKISKNLTYLDKARKTMRRFPDLKDLPTVVIAGTPNVGKSTLLAQITGTKPEIAPYPFTTQSLNVATKNGIQYIDTPGLLDRPLSERNDIEKHAILALKHLAKIIIYVFDPSEMCGYEIEQQKHLLKDIKEQFEIPIIEVSNKTDITKAIPKTIAISAQNNKGIEELQQKIDETIQHNI